MVRKASPNHCLPERHASLLGDSLRGDVLRTNQGDQTVNPEMREAIVTAGAGSFGCETLSPEIAAHVVADLDERFAIHLLTNEAAIAHQFAARPADHGP